MKSVAAICLALLLMCADAMALTLRNFNEYAMDVDEALAAKDACRFEHDISDETFERMKAYVRAHGAQKEML